LPTGWVLLSGTLSFGATCVIQRLPETEDQCSPKYFEKYAFSKSTTFTMPHYRLQESGSSWMNRGQNETSDDQIGIYT
jgi:hypothetical protein